MAITLTISVTDYANRNISLNIVDSLTTSPPPSPYYDLYYNMDGGGWNYWKSIDFQESPFSIYDYGLTAGITWGYYIHSIGSSEDSSPDYVFFGSHYEDDIVVPVSVSTSITANTHVAVNTITVPVAVTTATTTKLDAVDAITVSVSVSSSERSSQSVSDTYAWYVADDSGNVYTYAPTYYSDGGANINSSWRTKTVDFAELGYENAAKWKTVYGARVIYKDIDSSVPISLAYSTDGGQTWVQATRIVGAATNKTTSKSFFFTETAQYFDFKVDVISASKTFQIIGLEIEVDPEGPQVEMT